MERELVKVKSPVKQIRQYKRELEKFLADSDKEGLGISQSIYIEVELSRLNSRIQLYSDRRTTVLSGLC